MFDSVLIPINRAGWPFIGGAFVLAIILGFLAEPLFWIGLLLTLFCVYFFRDPPRVTPQRDGLVVSPADGMLQMIEEAVPPPELDMGEEVRTRISVFLNVFDVHVNRVPIGGKITGLSYRPGAFLNAALDKASELNERMSLKVETASGTEVAFIQIAGLIARRIKCDVKQGEDVKTGQVFGLIRFGSRMDIYLPEGVAPLVAPGQRMVAGETVIADLTSDEVARSGMVR
ncbi:MAG: phosphatidylserine decarboxylase [Pseudomonadota bacterium]